MVVGAIDRGFDQNRNPVLRIPIVNKLLAPGLTKAGVGTYGSGGIAISR